MKGHKLLYLTVSDCSKHRFAGNQLTMGLVIHDLQLFLSKHLDKFFSEVITYDYLKNYFDFGPTVINREIIDIVRREKPPFVLWQSLSLNHYEIEEDTFKAIRNLGAKIIGMFWDDIVIFDSFTKFYLPLIDYFITTDRAAVKKADALGIKGYLFEPAADPQVHRKMNTPFQYDVSFVGTRFLEREAAINKICKAGIGVNVFGNGWNKILSNSEMVEVFNKSKINLNFSSNAVNNSKKQINGRFFEVCMSGGFLLSEYAEWIEKSYDIGREIVCFHDINEAIDKIKFYLKHEDLRKEIAERGYSRSLKDHSWLNRLSSVFTKIQREEPGNIRNTSTAPSCNRKPAPNTKNTFRLFSDFHVRWAVALLLKEDFKDSRIKERYFDELKLSLKYNPYSVGTIFLYSVRFLSINLIRGLVKLYVQYFILNLRRIKTLIKLDGSVVYKLKFIKEKLLSKSHPVSVWIE